MNIVALLLLAPHLIILGTIFLSKDRDYLPALVLPGLLTFCAVANSVYAPAFLISIILIAMLNLIVIDVIKLTESKGWKW